jgi:hypothetical protein
MTEWCTANPWLTFAIIIAALATVSEFAERRA